MRKFTFWYFSTLIGTSSSDLEMILGIQRCKPNVFYHLQFFKLLVESKENWQDIIFDTEAKETQDQKKVELIFLVWRCVLRIGIVDSEVLLGLGYLQESTQRDRRIKSNNMGKGRREIRTMYAQMLTVAFRDLHTWATLKYYVSPVHQQKFLNDIKCW